MENLKIILGQWQKLMEKYDKDSMKLQRKISNIIKEEWTTSNNRSESTVKKFIDRAGQSKIKSKLCLKYLSEKFTTTVEDKLYRSMFALDTLMCQVENDLEDLNPEKKLKDLSSSESEEEEECETDLSENSSDFE